MTRPDINQHKHWVEFKFKFKLSITYYYKLRTHFTVYWDFDYIVNHI